MAVQLPSTVTTTFTSAPLPTTNADSSGYFSLVAWSVMLLLILLLARTKVGATILASFLAASILIVLAVGSPTVKQIFHAGAIPNK